MSGSCENHVKKEQKAEVVEQIAAQIEEAEAVYAVDYRGLTVTQAAELRANLREADASFRSSRTRSRCARPRRPGAEELKPVVEDGPDRAGVRLGDPALAAKALDTFAAPEPMLEFKGGMLEGELLTRTSAPLARLPGRDQLNAQLAGIVASPMTGLVRGLGSMLSGLAIALGQIQEQRAAEAPAGAEPEPQAEAQPEAQQRPRRPRSPRPRRNSRRSREATNRAEAEADQTEPQQSEPEKEAE